MAVRPGGHRDMPQSNTAGFEFIAGPIQALFKDQPGGLSVMLKMLSVLAVRFRQQYIHTPTMDWNRLFDISLPFLEDCLTSTMAADMARSMSSLDEQNFAEITPQDLVAEGAVVGQLLAHWRALSISTWECCAALPELVPYLQECAQVSSPCLEFHRIRRMLQRSNSYNYLVSFQRT